MDQLRYRAFLNEFPFLEEVLRKSGKACYLKIKKIMVKRVDDNLLHRTLAEEIGYEYLHWQKIWAAMPDGSAKEVPVLISLGMTVIEAMEGLEDATHLVFLEEENMVTGRNTSQYGFWVIVYKPGREASIREMIEKKRRKALSQVRREADF